MEGDDHDEVRRRFAIKLHRFGEKAEIEDDPTDEARPQLAEELQVYWSDAWVQLSSEKKVVNKNT